MPSYRIYFLEDGAHISKPPTILECDDDEQAIQQACQFIGDRDVELWLDSALIAKFPKRAKASVWVRATSALSLKSRDGTDGMETA